MIVRCTHIISPVTGEVENDHPGIRIGTEYPVLEVLTKPDQVLLRIPDRLGTTEYRDTPSLWDAAMFTVVSDRMPRCWVAELEEGRLTLAPCAWQRPGFWEDYFDDMPAAVEEYDRLKAEILADS
ncbi:hypothetical protein ACFZAB_31185 [Streptomyces albogriseolus]|uniref:hypothetical protein n=1 Tax=Streptomyces albogriseolus TaxID=1887 RepID=UPI0022530F71|nr:hypothetical protein [Streptomyces viridodiastaticus]MCX4617992.1 hypothetical protein [Streptomyces viridodiastaticus]MCX4625016.1 hypothetical protein [Streptomyces viridodiastaticus]